MNLCFLGRKFPSLWDLAWAYLPHPFVSGYTIDAGDGEEWLHCKLCGRVECRKVR